MMMPRHDQHQGSEPAERDDQADQKQQVVGAFEDVPEAGRHKGQGGLAPARIELDQPCRAPPRQAAQRMRGLRQARPPGSN
jgi:hypothetical protein